MNGPSHFVFRVSVRTGTEYLASGPAWTADKARADLMDADTAAITAHDWNHYFASRGGSFAAHPGQLQEQTPCNSTSS